MRFAKDPTAIGGESIRCVEEKVIGSVLKNRQPLDGRSYVGFKVDPVLLLDRVPVRIDSMFGDIPRPGQCFKGAHV